MLLDRSDVPRTTQRNQENSLDDFFRKTAVDRVYVLSQGTARFGVDLLYLLESSATDEESPCFGVVWQNFAELGDDVFQDVWRGVMQQRLKSWKVDALLEQVLESFL